MSLDPLTLALQLVNALVLVWLLSRFLFRPVSAAIAARRASVDETLDAAAAARAAAEEEATRLAAARAAFDDERATRLESVRQEAAALGETLRAEAERERAAREARAAGEREREETRRRRALEAEASALALDIARRLLERLPAGVQIEPFVDTLAGALAALPERQRERIGRGGVRLSLALPRAPSDAERARLVAALGDALGHEVDIETRVEPALVAGIELESDDVEIRASLRGDLDRVARALEGSTRVAC